MELISCEEMKKIDSYAVDVLKIPSIILMENAAQKVLKNIDLEENNYFTIVCGRGNNAGDGLALARLLILAEKTVDLFILGDPHKLSGDARLNLEILVQLDQDYELIQISRDLDLLKKSILASDLVLDAILGIGLNRNVEGIFKSTIDLINKYSRETLALDVPSGLNADTGQPMGTAIIAQRTVTFHLVKQGLMNNSSFQGNFSRMTCRNIKNYRLGSYAYTGQVILEDIGIPKKASDFVLKSRLS